MRAVETRICCWALVVGAVSLSLGCGRGGVDRCAINGSVTMTGEPVDGGNIQFAPLTVGQGSASGAVVQAGRYSVPRESGLVAGKYRVRIYWPEKAGREQGPNVPLARERIPAKYNTGSELTVEVRQGSDNTFDFALQ